MEESDKKGSGKSLALGMLIGTIAGAIGGILFAPKAGKETRADIANYYNEMKDKVADRFSKAKDATKETYNRIVSAVVSGYSEARKISKEEAEEIRKELERGYEKMKR